MLTRSLGKTDVRVTELALGTWGLAEGSYGPIAPSRFEATVKSALDAGVRTFDLSPVWGPDGASERVVGRLTQSLRDECTYITRGGVERQSSGVRTRFDRASIVADCEASLARLGTDRLDVLLLQRPSEHALRAAELVEATEQLVRDGKLRAWGVTMSAAPELRMAISAGAQVVCLPYNLFHSDVLDELVSSVVVAGTGVLARSPLAYGLLAGAFTQGQGFVAADHRSRRWSAETLSERIAAVEAFAFLAQGDVESPAEAALRWVLTNELVSSCVVGARTPAQAKSAARASSGPPYLRDADLARVPQVLAALGL